MLRELFCAHASPAGSARGARLRGPSAPGKMIRAERPDNFGIGISVSLLIEALLLYQVWFLRK
jgi:hypothetical protein